MLKTIKNHWLLAIVIIAFSCTSDDPAPLGAYEVGVYVTNEGNFGTGNGSLSFINEEGEITQSVFSSENAGLPLGDVIQSIYMTDENGYVIANNSNLVQVVDPNTLKSKGTIDDVLLPRYMTSENGVGYLTEWKSFDGNGTVAAIDLSTNQITERIEVGYLPEGLLIRNGKLFVSNSGSSSISVIDLVSFTMTSEIATGTSPSEMVLDGNDNIWVACAGGYNADWTLANDGALISIDGTNKINTEVSLEMNIGGKIAMANESLYFTAGTTAYVLNTATGEKDVFVEQEDAVSFYGIGTNKNGQVYITDSNGFQAAGFVYVFSNDGVLQDKLNAGIGPNGFWFNGL